MTPRYKIEFRRGQRVRITARFANIDGVHNQELDEWVGLEGTVRRPRVSDTDYDLVAVDSKPEEFPNGFLFRKGELEAIGPTDRSGTPPV
jgi:hypothetical protein